MFIILTGIRTLVQHIQTITDSPEAYWPKRCPHCGFGVVWSNGCYYRKSGKRNGYNDEALALIPILRFRCAYKQCRESCYVLPECIPPRRWYLWSVQQAKLSQLFAGRLPEDSVTPNPRTIYRWWHRLRECFELHRFCLADSDASLGADLSPRSFWQACFEKMSFSSAMSFMHHHHHEVIP